MTAVSLQSGSERDRRLESTPVHIVGLALVFTAGGMALSAVVDLVAGSDAASALLASATATAVVGTIAWRGSRIPARIAPRAVFSAVTWAWLAMSVAGAVPYLLSGTFDTIDGALFESISGFTCTGSTVLTPEGFETTSAGVMWWRQLTQWFGGMGIIVLAVAVLPFVGVGGLELISAEAPGPASDRLAPRVSETARRLWLVYLGFTFVSLVALMVTGLSLYDASAHALALVSTGGFSPNIDSIGAYDDLGVELVVVVGMVLGGTSFTLHYQAVRGRLGAYLQSSEFILYLLGIIGATAVVSVLLATDGAGIGASVRNALFNVVTLATSTGFGNATGDASLGNFAAWVPAAQVILFSFMWSGGMTGSTSGGIKVLRVQVMGRVAWREMVRARRLRVVRPITQGDEPIEEATVSRITGFVLLYFLIAVGAGAVLTFGGTDITTSFSGSVSAMGNMGPALGEAGPTSSFLVFPRAGRMLLALLMLVGRLEVFPMVLLAVAGVRQLGLGARRPLARLRRPG